MKYPARIPLHAGGIRSQAVQGRLPGADAVAYRLFLSALEPMDIGGRLAKGRKYALSGQVLSISFPSGRPGRVEATVLGTRSEPYRVSVVFRRPRAAAAKRIVESILSDPAAVAMLFADAFPMSAQEAFRKEGCDLFPGGKLPSGGYDTTVSCTCPDWANPCKHSLAVLHLLAEEAARRPLSLLEWRGVDTRRIVPEDAEPRLRRAVPSHVAIRPVSFWRGAKASVPAIANIVERASAKARHVLEANFRTKSKRYVDEKIG